MKNYIYPVAILTVCCSLSPALAQNKVVVVPLGGKKCTSPAENSFINSIGITFNLLPAGTFIMGSPVDEPGRDLRDTDETQHEVTLTKPFYIQVTEVTQQQWMDVIGNNPSNYKNGAEYPVENITWFEAAFFSNALSVREGRSQCYTLTNCSPNYPDPSELNGMTCTGVSINVNCTGYRLPTEAEWEYAARAGTTTAYANPYSFDATITETGSGVNSNLAAMGWYVWNQTIYGYEYGTKPVAQKQANRWGLYDMSGNVWEWCEDWYAEYPTGPVVDPRGPASGSLRVTRGCGHASQAYRCRSAHRRDYDPNNFFNGQGFRLVLSTGR